VTAGTLLKFVRVPFKPDHSHGHPATNHSVQQNTNLFLFGTGSKGLSILYLYAVYIYIGLDDLDAREKQKENVGEISSAILRRQGVYPGEPPL